MSKILVVGNSIQEARAIAHEIAESRGEVMGMRDASETHLTSDKHTYEPVNVSQVLSGKLPEGKFDEVHVIGSVSAQNLKKVEAAVNKNVTLFEQDPNNTHFFYKK